MIKFSDVSKVYPNGTVGLKDIDLTIQDGEFVAIIGRSGAGKSTLLRIIGGADYPTRGRVRRYCRVSWPMANGGLEGTLTGRQNAKFVCRIHGFQNELPERIARIEEFAELGKAFDEPIQTYSSGMRSRLQFALSLAFDFDVYISDEVTAAGDAAFRKKAQQAFQNLAHKASIIMVAHNDATLKAFCESGILLKKGKATWFNKLDDALLAYKESYSNAE